MADEEKQAGENEEPKKSNKMLFIIIGVVGLLVVGGGGFFAYTKFLAPPPVEEEEAMPQEKPEAVGEMFSMKPFVVNLADPKGKRYLKIKMSLELETPEALERITKLEPKLQDIVIMMLTSLSFEEVMTPEGKLRIRDELQERFNQVTRPDKVTHIYFTEFVVQ